MGLFGGLGRLIQGKPVFEVPDQTPNDQSSQSQNTSPPPVVTPSYSGPKVVPEASIERCEAHLNGSHMRLTCHIKNHSSQQIMLDKIRLLGTMRELDTYLKPGEAREFIVFDNERPKNRNYDDAYVAYKNQEGDYFEAHHIVEFKQENDQSFSVTRFRLIRPIKDI